MPRIIVWMLATIAFCVIMWGMLGFASSAYSQVVAATFVWFMSGMAYHLIFGVAPNKFGK